MTGKTIRKQVFGMVFRALAPAAVLLLSSCARITTHTAEGKEVTMTQHEFADYVERVFRYHNRVVSALIEKFGIEDGSSEEKKAALSQAEARMMEVCRPLNETISENLAGGDVSLDVKRQLVDSVPECEKASQVVDNLAH